MFTRDFLLEGIRETAAWQALGDRSVDDLRSQAKSLLDGLEARRNPNEAQTEDDVVYPLLESVGWHHRDVQPNASVKARLDVPDALLFADEPAKTAAAVLEPWRRFSHGLCVVEAKRWGRALDCEERGRKGEEGTPSSQMLRYRRRVDDITKGRVRWGILTNGRVWRLYFQGALSVSEDFFEIDLGKVLAVRGCDLDLLDRRPDAFGDDRQWRDHILRLFVVVFGRDSFLADEQGETFHQLALREGKRWEARVARSLSNTVFETIFPGLAQGLAAADTARRQAPDADYLAELREGALILLYRLLFVLYAEDRNLLPDENGPYAPYCLTRIRQEVAARANQPYPKGVVTLWPRLTTIFRAISEGNDDLGIPAYNGGLFDPAAAPILNRVQLPDAVLARVIFGLSHHPDAGDGRGPKYINYRDLSVQQLGSVYEGILEFGLRVTADGRVEPDADDEARHRSGSYYTPDDLVALIIERAVGPLVDERVESFRAAALALVSDRRPVAARLEEMAALDPAVAILSLRIIDPAMGSGHFLVSLVDWLSDSVLDAIEDAKAVVTHGRYTNNTGYFVPAGSDWLTAVLNAPVGWHYAWRRAQHGKDEALRYFTSFVESYPVPNAPSDFETAGFVGRMGQLRETTGDHVHSILDWLRHEFGLEKPGQALAQPHLLDADGFVAALRKALPKSRKFSAADVARLKQEHATTLGPARAAADEALVLERRLSDLVNAAYGLTPEEVQLMWDTAPPRMPFSPGA